jgi:large repetitive protein
VGSGQNREQPGAAVQVGFGRVPVLAPPPSFQLLEAPPNQPPSIDAVADQVNVEGDVIALTVGAQDPDRDVLTFVAEGLPAGLAIDPSSGEITGVIAGGAADDSPYTVEVTVTDPDDAIASSEFG